MDDRALSKEISYALRHAPWEYELEIFLSFYIQSIIYLIIIPNFSRYPADSQQLPDFCCGLLEHV